MSAQPSPFGDISIETFLQEYWQKKPLLIRNAFPDLEPPVGPDDLAGLACEEEVHPGELLQRAVSQEVPNPLLQSNKYRYMNQIRVDQWCHLR